MSSIYGTIIIPKITSATQWPYSVIGTLASLVTQYDSNMLGRQKVFKGEGEDIVYNESTHTLTIKVSNCEQLMAVSDLYVISSDTDRTIIIELQNDLYFQDDSIYKKGIVGNGFQYLWEGENSIDHTTRIEMKPKDGLSQVVIQGLQITGNCFFLVSNISASSGGSSINKYSQGIKIKNVYFKDCVFTKVAVDCFQAETGEYLHDYSQRLALASLPIHATYNSLIFDSCKISLHINALEYGYGFDATNNQKRASDSVYFLVGSSPHWKNCSIYIEYSDLQTNTTPYLPEGSIPSMGNASWLLPCGYFSGNKENCSIIVRNLALACKAYDTASYRQLISAEKPFSDQTAIQATNCSLDIECYLVWIEENPNANYNYKYYYKEGNSYRHIINFPVINSFISFKTDTIQYKDQVTGDIITYTKTDPENNTYPYELIGFGKDATQSTGYWGGANGVNIVNAGAEGDLTYKQVSHPNIKWLTEEQCKNPTELNKWGFFINSEYTYEILMKEEELNDDEYNKWLEEEWKTEYYKYYYFDTSENTFKNIPNSGGSAPLYEDAKFYRKVISVES